MLLGEPSLESAYHYRTNKGMSSICPTCFIEGALPGVLATSNWVFEFIVLGYVTVCVEAMDNEIDRIPESCEFL